MAGSNNTIPELATQIKNMFEEISIKLLQTNENIVDLTQALANIKTNITSSIASLNINIDRLINTFETIFQVSKIEETKKTIMKLTETLQDELDKKNASDMISELIQALLKMSKPTSEGT